MIPHYYYAHLSSNSDDTFHNIIMKVTGTERETIDRETLPEARLTDDWHTIRVEHETSGAIRVYVDDLEIPLMTAQDTTYPAGSVGFGSFDDRALFDDVVVSGQRREPFDEEVRLMDEGNDYSLGFFASAGFMYELQQSRNLADWNVTRPRVPGQSAPLQLVLAPGYDFARVIGFGPALP
jgi:hypothetical protein